MGAQDFHGGDVLRKLRLQAGYKTLTAFAERTGVVRQTLSKAEADYTKALPETIRRIADGLGLSVDELVARLRDVRTTNGHQTDANGNGLAQNPAWVPRKTEQGVVKPVPVAAEHHPGGQKGAPMKIDLPTLMYNHALQMTEGEQRLWYRRMTGLEAYPGVEAPQLAARRGPQRRKRR